jgi:hypothetical protein
MRKHNKEKTSKVCKTSNQRKETILDGLVILGDGLFLSLSLLYQFEARLDGEGSIQQGSFYGIC